MSEQLKQRYEDFMQRKAHQLWMSKASTAAYDAAFYGVIGKVMRRCFVLYGVKLAPNLM
jgi:hypothetical protein